MRTERGQDPNVQISFPAESEPEPAVALLHEQTVPPLVQGRELDAELLGVELERRGRCVGGLDLDRSGGDPELKVYAVGGVERLRFHRRFLSQLLAKPV